MSWETTTVGGRPADIFEPTQPNPRGSVVLFLHGHGGGTLVDKPAYTAELERHGLRCVCPHGGKSWWLDVPSPEFDGITPLKFVSERVMTWIDQHWQVQPTQIGLLGMSMGGQGVLQIAYRQPTVFPVIVAVSPTIDFHLVYGEGLVLDELFPDAETARQATAILQIQMLNWPRHQLITCDPTDAHWYDGAARMVMKLRSSGMPVDTDFETTAGGHTWEYFNTMAPSVVQFLAEKLEKESRRLV